MHRRPRILSTVVVCAATCVVLAVPQAASAAANLQTRINRAYSDANFLRTAAGGALVFLGLSFIPIIQLVTYWGFIIMFFVVLVLLVRWQIKHGRIPSKDVDYRRAKRMWMVSLLLWLLAIGIFLLREFMAAFLLMMNNKNNKSNKKNKNKKKLHWKTFLTLYLKARLLLPPEPNAY